MPLVTLRLCTGHDEAELGPGSEWKGEIYMDDDCARGLKAAVDRGEEPLFQVISCGYVKPEPTT